MSQFRRFATMFAILVISCAEGPPGPAPAPHPPSCASSVDFNTDRLNCGECGNVCPVDDHGETKCEHGCETDLDTAKDNCGSCGVRCGTGEHCEFGGCHYDKKAIWIPLVS